MALPHLSTARTRVTVLPPERADLMLDFYLRNRAHLTPWEPSRDESFYTLSHWHGRLRDSYASSSTAAPSIWWRSTPRASR